MRINLTKKDLVNLVYMQIGFSKQVSEHLINDFFSLIISNLQKEKKNQTIKLWYIFSETKKVKNWSKPKNKRKKNYFRKERYIV